MAASQAHVTAAVVNYNGMEHLKACLDSLVRQTYPDLEILVSDDVSTDGSVEFVRSNYPQVRIVQNPRNMGFVATANRAMRSATTDWVILLNNDIECEPDFVERLMLAADANPDVGIFAPKMKLFYARSVLNGVGNQMCKSCFGVDRGLGEKDEGQYDEPCEVFGACGGAMLIGKDILEHVGYMDPQFYFLFDDIDLCWRARLLGYRVMTVPDAVVYHKFGGFFGKASTFKYFLASRNRLRSFLKNYSLRTIIKLLPEVVKEDLVQIRDMYKFQVPSRLGMTISIARSYLWNILHLPSTYLARRRVQKSRVVSDDSLKPFIYQGPGRIPVVLPSYDIVDLDLFRQKLPKIDRIVMGLTDEDSLGPGWDAAIVEPGEDALHRTCTKSSYFYLRVLSLAKVWLNMRVKGVPKVMTGHVKLNGSFVGDFAVSPGEETTLSFKVPPAVLEEDVIEGIITLDDTWRPIDYFPGYDNRPLGINFYEISLDEKPLEPTMPSIRSVLEDNGPDGIKNALVLRSARPHLCARALRRLREDLPVASIALLIQNGVDQTPYAAFINDVIIYHGIRFSPEDADGQILQRLQQRHFDTCVVIYGHMPRSSYRPVDQLALATGAPLVLGMPPRGRPIVLRVPAGRRLR